MFIYISKYLSSFVKINNNNTISTKDFEIISLDITKPGLRHMSCSGLYRPPTGNNKSCKDFLKGIINNNNAEICILGDYNVDYLDRTNDERMKYIGIFKTLGVRQLISRFTRPNKRGSTCIDWIVTNCNYVKEN